MPDMSCQNCIKGQCQLFAKSVCVELQSIEQVINKHIFYQTKKYSQIFSSFTLDGDLLIEIISAMCQIKTNF